MSGAKETATQFAWLSLCFGLYPGGRKIIAGLTELSAGGLSRSSGPRDGVLHWSFPWAGGTEPIARKSTAQRSSAERRRTTASDACL
jgi:hypothetical protein